MCSCHLGCVSNAGSWAVCRWGRAAASPRAAAWSAGSLQQLATEYRRAGPRAAGATRTARVGRGYHKTTLNIIYSNYLHVLTLAVGHIIRHSLVYRRRHYNLLVLYLLVTTRHMARLFTEESLGSNVTTGATGADQYLSAWPDRAGGATGPR